MDREVSRTGPDISERFGYYPDGKLRYAIGGSMRYDYTYDCMGRLTGKSAGGRALLSYTYDPDFCDSEISIECDDLSENVLVNLLKKLIARMIVQKNICFC